MATTEIKNHISNLEITSAQTIDVYKEPLLGGLMNTIYSLNAQIPLIDFRWTEESPSNYRLRIRATNGSSNKIDVDFSSSEPMISINSDYWTTLNNQTMLKSRLEVIELHNKYSISELKVVFI